MSKTLVIDMDQWKVDQVMDLRSKLLDNILIGDKQGELLMRASAAHGVYWLQSLKTGETLYNAGPEHFR